MEWDLVRLGMEARRRAVRRREVEVFVAEVDFEMRADEELWGLMAVGGVASIHDVEVWLDAPTGDSSDSIIVRIPCTSEAEAVDLVRVWEEAWNL